VALHVQRVPTHRRKPDIQVKILKDLCWCSGKKEGITIIPRSMFWLMLFWEMLLGRWWTYFERLELMMAFDCVKFVLQILTRIGLGTPLHCRCFAMDDLLLHEHHVGLISIFMLGASLLLLSARCIVLLMMQLSMSSTPSSMISLQ